MGAPKLTKSDLPPPLWKLSKMADWLSCSSQTLRRAIHAGKLRAEERVEHGKPTYFVTEADAIEYRARYYSRVKG